MKVWTWAILGWWLCAQPVGAGEMWRAGGHLNLLGGGNLDKESGLGPGGQLAYQLNDMTSFELSVSQYRASHPAVPDSTMNIVANALTARLHLSPMWRSLGLYGGAGVGLYWVEEPNKDDAGVPVTTAGEDTVHEGNRIRPHVGGGLTARVLEAWELFADYRYTIRNYRFQDDFDHGLFRVGVNVVF